MPTTKTTTKTTAKKATAKRAPKAPTTAQLADAALLVTNLRADLDAAVAARNALMAKAYAAGTRVKDIHEATGFASTGATQAAIKAGQR